MANGQDYNIGDYDVNTQSDMFDQISDQLKALSDKCGKNQESINAFAKLVLKMESKNADAFNKLAQAVNDLETNFQYDLSALANKTMLNSNQIIAVNNSCMKQVVSNCSLNVTNKTKILYSLAQNVLISDMKAQGYKVVYDYLYNHDTTWSELNSIKATCSPQSVLCVGGGPQNSDNLLLISCGNCQAVMTPTQHNTPVLNNGAYWYMTNSLSFGYAPNSLISQDQADTIDTNVNTRLSWHIVPGNGGWRLGSLTGLNSDTNYRKIMLLFL